MASVSDAPDQAASPVDEASAALARGDLLAAHDISASAIAAGADAERLRYLQVLALARMGDTDAALALAARYRLDESAEVDSLALRGRLLKDSALAADRALRPRLLREASEVYQAVAERTGDFFPAINAASLALLSGDRTMAGERARAVLAMSAVIAGGDYYATATQAEALLVLGEWRGAAASLSRAVARAPADEGARSSTRRQLGLLLDALGLSEDARSAVLAPLIAAPVVTFAGHAFREGSTGEAALAARIDAALDAHGIAIGYGALACGSDILLAEALLRRGGELHVVLPFQRDDFERVSVAPGGDGWIERWRRCLAAAAAVDQASDAGFIGDDGQFAYGSLVGMGLARLRARHLGTQAIQLAVWDGQASDGQAGTAADVALWRTRGGTTEVIAAPDLDRSFAPDVSAPSHGHRRALRAMIFTDYAGFSKLDEAALPLFWDTVMACGGDVLRRYGDAVLGANTWGDALFAVTADAASAAAVALDLQAEIGALAAPVAALGGSARMRVGVHFGPVYVARDPVTGRDNVFGTEVTRTARIEPITPTGEVYVTQQLAAMLAMEAADRFATRYVGKVKLAKGYGELKMFKLERA